MKFGEFEIIILANFGEIELKILVNFGEFQKRFLIFWLNQAKITSVRV